MRVDSFQFTDCGHSQLKLEHSNNNLIDINYTFFSQPSFIIGQNHIQFRHVVKQHFQNQTRGINPTLGKRMFFDSDTSDVETKVAKHIGVKFKWMGIKICKSKRPPQVPSVSLTLI